MWGIITVALVMVVWGAQTLMQQNEHPASFTEFITWVDAGRVARVQISGDEIRGVAKSNERFRTRVPPGFDGLSQRLVERNVIVEARSALSPLWGTTLRSWVPLLLFYWGPTLVLIVLLVLFMRRLDSVMRRLDAAAARQSDNAVVS
jgi:cell division protease FtsH